MKNLSIKEAALGAGVSENTIRNWIKTELLESPQKGVITQDSFFSFIENIAGKEKLNKRANKLYKEKQIEPKKTPEELLRSDTDSELLGAQYENLLSESYKNKEGIYYTPQHIIDDMFADFSIENISEKRFLDPCCGTGNFIIKALEIGFKPENIYGFDVDNNAVQIAVKRIFDLTGYYSQNIKNADFLEVASTLQIDFDCIYTNPPWGKKLSQEQKNRYSQIFSCGKSLDSSSLFVFASISVLKDQGKLGFLLPDSFFNISAFQDVRNKILGLQIEKLTDYGKPFKGLMTRAQAVVLSNQKAENDVYIMCQFKNQKYFRSQQSFIGNPKSIINFCVDKSAMQVIGHVLSLPHITLLGRSKWGLGIVTGNNKKYLSVQAQNGYIPVYRGTDITKGSIQPPTNFIPKDLNQYQQAAPLRMYRASEKIIYRFISSKLHFYCDTEQRYLLNSANFLILKDDFPISGQQLCEVLNSEFMTWFFQSAFDTPKILKGDLQTLPIHTKYFDIYDAFCENNYLDYLSLEKVNQNYRLKKKKS